MNVKQGSPTTEFMVTVLSTGHIKCFLLTGQKGGHMMDRNHLFENCVSVDNVGFVKSLA